MAPGSNRRTRGKKRPRLFLGGPKRALPTEDPVGLPEVECKPSASKRKLSTIIPIPSPGSRVLRSDSKPNRSEPNNTSETITMGASGNRIIRYENLVSMLGAGGLRHAIVLVVPHRSQRNRRRVVGRVW